MKLTSNICAIILGLLMVIELSSSSLVRRKRSSSSSSSSSSEEDGGGGGGGNDDSDDNGMMEKIQDFLGGLPLIGGPISGGIQKGMDGWHYSQDLTNGAIGRVLGGAFPCTLDVDSFLCEGVSTSSDVSDLMESILGLIPWVMMPDLFKSFMVFVVDLSWAPFMDLMFGGVKQ